MVFQTAMTADSLPNFQEHQPLVDENENRLKLQIAQEGIYSFLVEIVQNSPPEDVLREFKRLFIDCLNAVNSDLLPGIYGIFVENDEQEFHNTIQRCCYILINNWEANRKHKYVNQLIYILDNYDNKRQHTNCQKVKIFRSWLDNFIKSTEYQEIKLFASKSEEKSKEHWVNRYNSYLLVAQSFNENNPKEQQEAARKLSQRLKDKFKFELAMYIARSQSHIVSKTRYSNPSIFGDEVLNLIKTIVLRKGNFSYENIANIFLKQTQNQTFHEFKESLQKYLIFSVQNKEFVDTLKKNLSENILTWKQEKDEEIITKELLLRTCNRVINCLTTENGNEPSLLFALLLSQEHPLTLVIVLLKIILICKNARTHLEIRIADLINYYNKYSENECKTVIHFLEILHITFAIYAENVEYNLIKMKKEEENCYPQSNLDGYRVFSQLKLDPPQWQIG